jgi:hypothetical protein
MLSTNHAPLRAASVLLIAVFVMVQAGVAQEEKRHLATSVSQDATIYPVPNHGGICGRALSHRDWGGLRSKLADRGVQFESNVTQIYQGVASGGTNRTGRYSGSTDMVLKLDFHKLGLWPGGFLLVEAQVPFGNTVIPTRGDSAVNTLLPDRPAMNEIILPHLFAVLTGGSRWS